MQSKSPSSNEFGVAKFFTKISEGHYDGDISKNLVPDKILEAKAIYKECLKMNARLLKDRHLSSNEINKVEAIMKNMMEISCELVSPFVSCTFRPDNMSVSPSDFLEFPEQLNAENFEISWLKFTDEDLPIISGGAKLNINAKRLFTTEYLENWQQENDFLYEGLSFSWTLPGIDDWLPMDNRGIDMEFSDFVKIEIEK